jgi:hypothetical protein
LPEAIDKARGCTTFPAGSRSASSEVGIVEGLQNARARPARRFFSEIIEQEQFLRFGAGNTLSRWSAYVAQM